MAESIVKQTIKNLEKRRSELEPLIAEYQEVTQALEALQKADGGSAARTARRTRTRSKGRPKGRKAASQPKRQHRGGRAKRGQRQEQLLKTLKANPTTGISAAARQIGISPSQAHGLKSRLEKAGRLKQQGGKWVVSSG